MKIKDNCQVICRGKFGATECCGRPQNVLKPLTVYCMLH